MQEAVLQLIEVQLAQEEVTESPLGGDENAQLHASGYYALFVDQYRMMLRGCILKQQPVTLLR
ncbi:two-component system sensor kinase [Escherichia coli]|uniref:Two-component system sensor kinase n=1 Tax=Escherichia coli TaxID=562 RepID=A0A376TDM1_ECOLX|nr:two-component system sensor kinase [Escherichia coli]